MIRELVGHPMTWLSDHCTVQFAISSRFLARLISGVYVEVQFYPWFKFHFPLFLGMVMYDNEFKTKGNKI